MLTHPVVTLVVTESECGVQVHKPKLREFCAKLLAQLEDIVLCTMSTHSDPQLLPYIWALTFLSQLHSLGGLLHMYLFLPFSVMITFVTATVLAMVTTKYNPSHDLSSATAICPYS